MRNLNIKQFQPKSKLEIHVPGSKSMTNRALIMAAMGKGQSRLFGILKSDDSDYCMDVLRCLGVIIEEIDETTVNVISPGIDALQTEAELYIGSAGTTARFLPGLLAASQSNANYVMTASKQLQSRPIHPLIDALQVLGAQIDSTLENPFPLHICGSGIIGGDIQMSGDISSQFISGLLMAAPYFKKGLHLTMTTPIVQVRYVEMTLEMMRAFGVHAQVNETYSEFWIEPQKGYEPTVYTVEADVSTACYFFAMGLLLETEVCVHVNRNTVQPDIELLDILERFGATVTWEGERVRIYNNGTLLGNQAFDLSGCSDQALTIGVLAAFADGPVHLSGIGHIRNHESDRLQVLHDNLALLGVSTKITHDGVIIYPSQIKQNVSLPTYDDHRVAMAFALVGLKIGNIIIENTECTKKTFPDYFQYLATLGVIFEEVGEKRHATLK